MLSEKFLSQTPSGLWHENYGKKASIYVNTLLVLLLLLIILLALHKALNYIVF